jgi:pre-mRNA-splicing factor CWC26
MLLDSVLLPYRPDPAATASHHSAQPITASTAFASRASRSQANTRQAFAIQTQNHTPQQTTMPLADYLAQNYLSADTKPSKKRKRKEAKADGLIIADDNANDWTNAANPNSSDEDAPTISAGSSLVSGLNKPAKKWVTIGASAPKDSEQAAADAFLADAQAESRARDEQDDDAPVVTGEEVEAEGPMMGSGAMAGLQSADKVTAALKRKKDAEMKAIKDAGLDPTGKAQETIYRDASGRIINVAMKRAELRAKAEEEERKKVEELESRKGDVQRREKEERLQALRDVKVQGVARHADDETMKERQRWNDPMAQLLATKKSSGKAKVAKSKSSGKSYMGAAEPNRYGIRPGWRWDGVDRSNGFEKKWFAARNAAKDRKDLEYAWQMDE